MPDQLNQPSLTKFADKDYRDGFLGATVRGWIAYQVQALREKLVMTQAQFAEHVGTTQSVISRMESDKSAPNVQTLLDMASKLDLALVVQFVSYPDFLARTGDMSSAALQPSTIYESLAAPTPPQAALAATLWPQGNNQKPERDDAYASYRSLLSNKTPIRDQFSIWENQSQRQFAEPFNNGWAN